MEIFDRLAGALSLSPSTVGLITVLLVFLFGLAFGWKFKKWAIAEDVQNCLHSRNGINFSADLKGILVLKRDVFEEIDVKADLWDAHQQFVKDATEADWIVEVHRESKRIYDIVLHHLKKRWPRYTIWQPADRGQLEMRDDPKGEWMRIPSDVLEVFDRPTLPALPDRPQRLTKRTIA